MRLTNRYNLPTEIVRAIENDPYSKGEADISVTEVIGPPRIRVLKKRYPDECVEDVADRLFTLYGQAVHTILERAAHSNVITEERRSIQMEGWVISGAADVFDPDRLLLRDYKFVGVGSIFSGLKPEWEAQLNCYAHIWRETGTPVEELQIACLFRDWVKTQAEQKADYPPPILLMDVPVWPDEDAADYLRQRVLLHQDAEKKQDAELPICTPEERWDRGEYWVVKKKGRKTALRRCESGEEAAQLCLEYQTNDPRHEYYIEQVPPNPVRCRLYCPCLPVCEAGQRFLEGAR